ncbi:hypothetical protein P5G51_016250 [Virgibacillus sp. 179-BFC.A HS]|uniref:Uncharacterized protein n=1 Tax=Tigheibacillus jepli TaxID=3035914 RepID=A0ABU5CLD2_9BACI|nr:hypothetical protein [Virgibacillus sp. 179-BFC.A HS]MDY0406706.1 hypothetical protein [Virgibacillus sp. 179-BFC.A HS]
MDCNWYIIVDEAIRLNLRERDIYKVVIQNKISIRERDGEDSPSLSFKNEKIRILIVWVRKKGKYEFK